MTKNEQIKVGSVVQVDPEYDKLFAGCFLLVTELKSWGVQGFVAMPKSRDELPGAAYYRVAWENLAYIGQAEWMPADIEEESD